MVESWLRGNARMQSLGIAAGVLVIASGGGLFFLAQGNKGGLLQILAWLLLGAGLLVGAGFAYLLKRPRLGFQKGRLLIFVNLGSPIAIPIEMVECFFLGEQPTEIMRPSQKRASMSTIVVRIAQRAKELQAGDIPSRIGMWKEGYITLYGLWCEPIHADLLHTLNRRLREVHREIQAKKRENSI